MDPPMDRVDIPVTHTNENVCKIEEDEQPVKRIKLSITSDEEEEKPPIDVVDLTYTEIPPLENHVITKEVMKFLSTRELLNLRLINHLWKNLASFVIFSREEKSVLHCHFSKKQKVFCISRSKDELSLLNKYLEDSVSIFPCSAVSFSSGPLDSFDAQNFFSPHGKNIKKLYLDLNEGGYTTTLQTFRKLLVQDAPNLHHLHLESVPRSWTQIDTGELFPSQQQQQQSRPVRLSQLTKLTLGRYFEAVNVLKDIIKVSPYLEEIEGYPSQMMEESLMERKKKEQELIKSFHFEPQPKDRVLYCKFSLSTNKLKNISFDFTHLYMLPESWAQIATAVNHIFQSSSSTLEKIEKFQYLRFLPGIQIPRLEKVKEVFYESVEFQYEIFGIESDHRIVPGEQKLRDIFPNVEKLGLRHVPLTEEFEEEVLTTEIDHGIFTYADDDLPSVTTLELDNYYPPIWLDELEGHFVNVKHIIVRVPNVLHLEKYFDYICKSFKKVQTIRLICPSVDVGMIWNRRNSDFWGNLDSIITGIPPKTCYELRKKKNPSMMDTLELEKIRNTNSSIHQMLNLQSFTMELGMGHQTPDDAEDDWDDEWDGQKPLISHISGEYGFKLLKERQPFMLTIKAQQCPELEGTLDTILPYVDKMEWLEY